MLELGVADQISKKSDKNGFKKTWLAEAFEICQGTTPGANTHPVEESSSGRSWDVAETVAPDQGYFGNPRREDTFLDPSTLSFHSIDC
ncbi:hypothetical protein ABEB36_013813 [Hypothenemus hampei]|uniref:Uncharacterized protein n=1 Tax=Hypothenemus hampei TaxID=57062 RepID=A0ABD1E6A9_HYPHA